MLARTIGKDVFSPLAAECVQLGLNLTDAIDDPDLRRCTYVARITQLFFFFFFKPTLYVDPIFFLLFCLRNQKKEPN